MNAKVFSVFNGAALLFISLIVCKLIVFYVQETLLLPSRPPSPLRKVLLLVTVSNFVSFYKNSHNLTHIGPEPVY